VGGRLPVVSDVQWAVQDGVVAFTGSQDGFAHLASNLRLQHRRRPLHRRVRVARHPAADRDLEHARPFVEHRLRYISTSCSFPRS
jgi:hypothetical protein